MSYLAQPPKAGATGRRQAPVRSHFSPPTTKSLQLALESARRQLLQLQKPDGHWCGELQGDTILESEYIMLMAYLGRDGDSRLQKAAHYIVQQERPDGAWSNYPGGPVDISVSVKAYFALKLCGYDAEHPVLRRACHLIRAGGG